MEATRELFFICREPLRGELYRSRKLPTLERHVHAETEYQAVMANFNEAINLQIYGQSTMPVHASTSIQDLVDHVIGYQDQRTIVVMNELMHVYAVVA